jgi:hypothetical protein
VQRPRRAASPKRCATVQTLVSNGSCYYDFWLNWWRRYPTNYPTDTVDSTMVYGYFNLGNTVWATETAGQTAWWNEYLDASGGGGIAASYLALQGDQPPSDAGIKFMIEGSAISVQGGATSGGWADTPPSTAHSDVLWLLNSFDQAWVWVEPIKYEMTAPFPNWG